MRRDLLTYAPYLDRLDERVASFVIDEVGPFRFDLPRAHWEQIGRPGRLTFTPDPFTPGPDGAR